MLNELSVVQLDFFNVLVPAHYQVPFARLGSYGRVRLDDVVQRSGDFTEQGAHEASIVPIDVWPLLTERRRTRRVQPWGFEKFLAKHPDYATRVLDEVRAHGPLCAADLPAAP